MRRNEHKPGNMAVLVSAPTTGLRTFADTVEASRGAGLILLGRRKAPIRRGISHLRLSRVSIIFNTLAVNAPTISGYQYW